jgi:prephenate dehydrogenase
MPDAPHLGPATPKPAASGTGKPPQANDAPQANDVGDDGGHSLQTVIIIGTGLIGTSVALALRARGIDVAVRDRDQAHEEAACEMGAGRRAEAGESFQVAVLAVPPHVMAHELKRAQDLGLAATYTDVCSVKFQPVLEAETLGADMSSFVGGHPLAGRELSGPGAARRDLFVGRPWILVPHPATSQRSVSQVRRLVELCGAIPTTMSAQDHDAAVASVSHLPHVVSTLLAAHLLGIPKGHVDIAGSGLRDTTRLAAGDPTLWREIVVSNVAEVAAAMNDFDEQVHVMRSALAAVLDGSDSTGSQLMALLEQGVEGRNLIPGKHGGPRTDFATVAVVIRDAPGELARLLTTAGEAGINVEDVRLDHERGHPEGVAELAVTPSTAARLTAILRSAGWTVAS